MHVICLTGLIGSGKDMVADYIKEKYGYEIIQYANILREICRREGLEVTRDNLQDLRVKYGNTFLAEEAVRRAKASGNSKIILTPIRRSEDFLIPKQELENVVMILVDATPETRFGRLKHRMRENDPQDFKEFQRQEAREFEIFDFGRTFSYAEYRIDNNDGEAELFNQVDGIMKKIEAR